MTFFNNIVRDLRDKKLWPIALVLVAALIAVPMLLSKSSPAPTTVSQVPPAAAPPSTALPAVSVKTTESTSKLIGRSRNPFLQLGGGAAPTHTATSTSTSGNASAAASPSTPSTPSTTSSSSATGSSTGSSSGGASSSSGSSGSSGGTSSGSTTPTPIPVKPAPPAPSVLTKDESYQVTLAITNATGNLNTIDSLQRLSPLPSANQPLLVELGVLQGGKHVLFAVQPGTVVSGGGTCTPGPIDCQILSVTPGHTEGVSVRTSTGTTSVALFAVTAVAALKHGSAAAAAKARQSESAVGRKLLNKSSSNALSLFAYKPSIGAIVDLRNLTVGGS